MRGSITALASTAAFCVLSGCALVWGGAYKIRSEDPSGVVIVYDAALTDSRHIEAHANESCAKYQKVAVPKQQRVGLDMGGSISEISFVCDTPEDAVHEHRTALRDFSIDFTGMVTQPHPYTPPSLPSSTYTLHSQPPVIQPPALTPMPPVYTPPPPAQTGCLGVVHVPFNTALPCPDNASK